jgi:4-hydroxybenzoate polyprenyltransferase
LATSNRSKSLSFSASLYAYVELMRPANIVTAFADILAGFAAALGVMGISLAHMPVGLGWLLVSTLGLYGGGVVFNDFFDARLDAAERPERAIPEQRASKTGAGWLGAALLALGIAAAFTVSAISGILAIFIAACALFYNAKAKHSALFGPLFMGLCRGGNLLLGCSIISAALMQVWFLALIPIAFIGAITLISQGEVHGGKKTTGFLAFGVISLITISLLILAFLPSYRILTALPFVIIFGAAVLPAFYKAAFIPSPEYIRKAVERGVLSLILLNSAIAAGFSGFILGGIVLILLPVSMLLARLFAAT